MADLAIVVVQVPRPTEKVPAIEQTYSAGAVCLSLLNAALAQENFRRPPGRRRALLRFG